MKPAQFEIEQSTRWIVNLGTRRRRSFWTQHRESLGFRNFSRKNEQLIVNASAREDWIWPRKRRVSRRRVCRRRVSPQTTSAAPPGQSILDIPLREHCESPGQFLSKTPESPARPKRPRAILE